MKRILSLILLFILLPASVFAEAQVKTYQIPELKLSIDVPENLYVFTRDVKEGDAGLSELGKTAQQIRDLYQQSDIYLNALPIPPAYEILLLMNEDESLKEIENFNRFNETELLAFFSQIQKEGESVGVHYKGSSVYKKDDIHFLVLDAEKKIGQGIDVKLRQFYTVYNGKAYHITLSSYSEGITQEMLDVQKLMVDSLSFEDKDPAPSKSFKLGENIGYLLGVALAILLVVIIIVFIKRRGRKEPDVF